MSINCYPRMPSRQFWCTARTSDACSTRRASKFYFSRFWGMGQRFFLDQDHRSPGSPACSQPHAQRPTAITIHGFIYHWEGHCMMWHATTRQGLRRYWFHGYLRDAQHVWRNLQRATCFYDAPSTCQRWWILVIYIAEMFDFFVCLSVCVYFCQSAYHGENTFIILLCKIFACQWSLFLFTIVDCWISKPTPPPCYDCHIVLHLPLCHFHTVTLVTTCMICHSEPYDITKRSTTTTNSATFPSFETNTKPFMSLSSLSVCQSAYTLLSARLDSVLQMLFHCF
jgi:hypothetical protein